MKPSDFPRDLRFRTPGPVFVEDGVVHLRRYRDVERVLLDGDCEEFNQDASCWSRGERLNLAMHFFWLTARRRADGSPGRHDALRTIVEPYFRPRAVENLAPMVRAHALDLIRRIVAKGTGEFDMARELAYLLALRTIMSMIGLPLEREDWVRERVEPIGQLSNFHEAGLEAPDVEGFLWDLIRSRRAHPGDRLVDVLIASWEQGALSDLELLGYIWGLAVGGYHDPGTNLANSFCLLDEFGLLDEARAHLDDELWLRRAGEEILRMGTPFPSGYRTAVADVTLDCGFTIPAGSPVRLWFSAANRDEAVNGGNPKASSPEVFDVTRRPNRHLTFGKGVYRCVGAELARLEARVALQTVLAALPGVHMAQDRPFARRAGIDDGVIQATFRFDQSTAEKQLSA